MEATQQEQPKTTGTVSKIVTYDNYSNSKLSCTSSEQKTIPGTGPGADPPSQPQYYYQIPLMYNLGTPEKPVLNDFMFETAPLKTSFGIQSKPAQGGKNRMDHSIMVKFDGNDPEHNKLIETFHTIHKGCAFVIGQMKGAVKMYNFNVNDPVATGLKDPIYSPRDAMTGEAIKGRSQSMFLKLFSRGHGVMAEQTLFTGLDGKPIPWTLLNGVEMDFIPLIHVKRIYVGGGKASIQMEVVSAIVTSIRARNTTTAQMDTIERLNAAQPNLADTVSAQLAKISLDRQDQLMDHSIGHDESKSDTPQPTFSGIAPLNKQGYTEGKLPDIPKLNNVSMKDFVSSAPVRNTTDFNVDAIENASEEVAQIN